MGKKDNKKGKVQKNNLAKSARNKEILITVIVLIFAIIIGIIGGKALYEAMYGKI